MKKMKKIFKWLADSLIQRNKLMIERTVKIINKAGLHTRPAATIVKMAAKYKCEFFISS